MSFNTMHECKLALAPMICECQCPCCVGTCSKQTHEISREHNKDSMVCPRVPIQMGKESEKHSNVGSDAAVE